MYWMGDSAWGWQYNLPKVPREILQGITDNIPFCCVIYYTFVKIICVLLHPHRSINKPDEANPYGSMGQTPDLWVFGLLYKHVAKLFPHEKIVSDDFRKLQYWRCPICKVTGRKSKILWNGLQYEW